MKVELIIPIEGLQGKLKQDGYYFRQYRGQQIVQRCPTKWKDTPARKAAREKFAAKYAGSHPTSEVRAMMREKCTEKEKPRNTAGNRTK